MQINGTGEFSGNVMFQYNPRSLVGIFYCNIKLHDLKALEFTKMLHLHVHSNTAQSRNCETAMIQTLKDNRIIPPTVKYLKPLPLFRNLSALSPMTYRTMRIIDCGGDDRIFLIILHLHTSDLRVFTTITREIFLANIFRIA